MITSCPLIWSAWCYPLMLSSDKHCYTMLSSHRPHVIYPPTSDVITPSYHPMLSSDVIIQCYHPMLSSDVIIRCYHPMLSSDVIIRCYHPMLSSNVIIQCYHPMLSSDVIIRCYYPMLSSDVIIPMLSRCYHPDVIAWSSDVITPHFIIWCWSWVSLYVIILSQNFLSTTEIYLFSMPPPPPPHNISEEPP
jgi:hypothetical protein